VVNDPPFRVTEAVLRRVSDHARASYESDEEACGYLTGPHEVEHFCDEAVPLANLANRYHALDPETYPRTGRTYFLIDPLKFEKAMKTSAESGRPLRILYHSHLDVGAYFSESDAAAATMGGDQPSYDGLRYLVTSIRQGVVDDHKLFAWDGDGKTFVEVPLEVVAGK
jgi:[CysO sulfur-carrier protein]-S-L-cysteine hydrolase